MRLSGRTIAILFHENDRPDRIERFAVAFLAEFWRQDGNEVVPLFGTRRFVPADLLLLHVDLSVVPRGYLTFAERYPIALNRRATDIRKSQVSANLVRPDDGYGGPVIVKSDRNYAGVPEGHLVGPAWLRRIGLRPRALGRSFRTSLDYRIHASASEVPRRDFGRGDRVVEKFLPEREGDRYFVRNYQFLGDRNTCMRLGAANPIVNDETMDSIEPVEPHPEILRAREQFGFDYGKFDYVVHEGRAVLLDANKTTGASRVTTPQLVALRRHQADGIYSYFDGREPKAT